MDAKQIKPHLRKLCCTSPEAAKILGVTSARIRQILGDGLLPGAFRWGKEWVIPRDSLKEFAKVPRKIGRPKSVAE